MPPTPFDPCKQWLGIDAVDIGDPRRLLGLAPHEADPMNVLKAAQARLATLHAIAPGPYDVARTALMKRVEEAREKLLAQIAATRPAVVRPPVVPPPPPPAGFAPPPPPGRPAAAPAAPEAEFPVGTGLPTVKTRNIKYRKSSGSAWIVLLLIAALGAAAGGLAWYKFKGQDLEAKPPSKPAAVELASKPVAPAAEPERATPEPSRRVKRPRPADPPAAMTPKPVDPEPPGDPAPAGDPKPPVDSTKEVEPLLGTALEALQRADFEAAEATIDAAHEKAGDAELQARVSRWGDLVTFARGFADYREKALASVEAGHEYDVDGKKVAVVEIDDKKFIYRFAGKNKTTPRDKIPGAILLTIVTDWFDEKPQNDLFLGAYHATKAEPDLEKARTCWQRAAQRGADASSLLPLLDDPMLRTAAQ